MITAKNTSKKNINTYVNQLKLKPFVSITGGSGIRSVFIPVMSISGKEFIPGVGTELNPGGFPNPEYV
jgi:hypothetical protein